MGAQRDNQREGPASGTTVIGLIGGVGAGKSAVARALAALGCVVFDADAEAKALLAEPAVRDAVLGEVAPGAGDGRGGIDLRALASAVFDDHGAKARLEAIVHPRVIELCEASLARARNAGAPGFVIDAALLLEAGLDRLCDVVAFVDAPRQRRLERVRRTRGWDEGELDRREAAQMSLERKRRRADVVLVNDADEAALRRRVRDALGPALASGSGGGSVPRSG